MNSKEVEQVLKKWFKLNPKNCNVEIAGRSFGGRYNENPLDPVSFVTAFDILRINFHPYELLTIINPEGISINKDQSLVMGTAEEVRLGYYSYGHEIKSEHWHEQIYQVREGYIQYREIPNREIYEDSIKFDEEYLVYISFPSI